MVGILPAVDTVGYGPFAAPRLDHKTFMALSANPRPIWDPPGEILLAHHRLKTGTKVL